MSKRKRESECNDLFLQTFWGHIPSPKVITLGSEVLGGLYPHKSNDLISGARVTLTLLPHKDI